LTAYVLDASVAIKWYIPEVLHEHAGRLLTGLKQAGLVLHAPDLLYAEAGNIIWKKLRSGECDPGEAETVLRALLAVPITIHPARSLLPEALKLASNLGITVYDGLYVALAVFLDCQLVTADRRLTRALFRTRWREFIRWLGDLE
jgi:predicted nucleic acid-binding protein